MGRDGPHSLEDESLLRGFVESKSVLAHVLAAGFDLYKFGKAPSLLTGSKFALAAADTYLMAAGLLGWTVVAGQHWLEYDFEHPSPIIRFAKEFGELDHAVRAAAEVKYRLANQQFWLYEQRFWQNYWEQVGPTLTCTEATVCELPGIWSAEAAVD